MLSEKQNIDFNMEEDVVLQQVEDNASDFSSSSEDDAVAFITNRKRKKKTGRRSAWPEEVIDDLVDIICSDSSLKQQLVCENTKKSANTAIYAKVLREMKNRSAAREQECDFAVNQVRNKFKSCVSWCKRAALTITTATGITRFKNNKGFGRWFDQLYPVVKSRDSCQKEQGIEPGSSYSTEVASVQNVHDETATMNGTDADGTSKFPEAYLCPETRENECERCAGASSYMYE